MLTRALVPALALPFALVACGGGDDAATIDAAEVDAVAVDAAVDARQIDAAPVCNAPNMVCGGDCVDVTSSEEFCGDCNTSCSGGTVCTSSACLCAMNLTIPSNPSFFMPMMQSQAGLNVGIGPMIGTTLDILVVGKSATDAAINTPHTLSGAMVGTPPFAAFGYDVSIASMTASAAYYATAGTLTFTKICLADTATGQMPGFAGTLAGAVFEAVDSLTNPVLVPNGCRIPSDPPATLPTITFSYGNVSCQ